MATRIGSAQWQGGLKGGDGQLEVGDGVFSAAYDFQSRFEEGEHTNPEELIAAAHAACFSMALAGNLESDGHAPESIRTVASVELRAADGGPPIRGIVLRTEGRVPGIDADAFREQAEKAKDGCPVSQALAGVPDIAVEAVLAD